MKRYLLATAVVMGLAAIAAGCGGSGKLSQPKLVQDASQSTVQIIGERYDGTGIVIDAQKGLVLTAAHVVAGQNALKARYNDQTTPIQVIGSAPCEDMAVARMQSPPAGIQSIQFGKAADLKAGDQVTVLGFPESLQNPAHNQKLVSGSGSVSVDGTVEATPQPDLPTYASVIEHQAPITYGDSGGPLVDSKAHLVGMNVLVNPEATNGQQGYAISADHIQQLLPKLEAGKYLAYVGWSLEPLSVNGVNGNLHKYSWQYTPDYHGGLVVTGVDSDSPADTQGRFFAGDYITDVNGQTVHSFQDVCDIFQSNEGHKVAVAGSNLSTNGKNYTVHMTIK
jgi:S1-C subfamily serine protease